MACDTLIHRPNAKREMLKESYPKICHRTLLLLSNVIDADHQNSSLFTNKGHCPSPLSALIAVLAKFHE